MTTDYSLSKRIRETRLFKSGGVTKLFLRKDNGDTSEILIPPTAEDLDSFVQSVVAGTNVTVDSTDPANPVVSATGGGVTSYFVVALPNDGSFKVAKDGSSNWVKFTDSLFTLNTDGFTFSVDGTLSLPAGFWFIGASLRVLDTYPVSGNPPAMNISDTDFPNKVFSPSGGFARPGKYNSDFILLEHQSPMISDGSDSVGIYWQGADQGGADVDLLGTFWGFKIG